MYINKERIHRDAANYAESKGFTGEAARLRHSNPYKVIDSIINSLNAEKAEKATEDELYQCLSQRLWYLWAVAELNTRIKP